jgi:tight adherence protein C
MPISHFRMDVKEMYFLTISFSFLIFITVLTVFYGHAQKKDNQLKRLKSIKNRNTSEIADEYEQPFIQRVVVPAYRKLIKRISLILPQKSGAQNKKTETNLRLAGLSLSVSEYSAIRVILFGVFFFGSFILISFMTLNVLNKLLIVLISMLASLILPILFIKLKINKRQTDIANELPDIMDILCVTMEAGLGFDAALIKIGERLSGVLVTELNIVHTEINFGKPRREALKSLSDRNSVEELKTFVGSIIQAEQLGIPINQVLKVQAEELRIKRKQKAEEKAMKAPVKMLIPLVLFVLPVLFIVLLGPTVLQLVKQFGGGI